MINRVFSRVIDLALAACYAVGLLPALLWEKICPSKGPGDCWAILPMMIGAVIIIVAIILGWWFFENYEVNLDIGVTEK